MTDPAEYKYDVFVSYSRADEEWVWGWLIPRLKEAGLAVCTDRESFDIGVPALVNMENAVAASRHTLLVLTPAWVDSRWARFESLLVQHQDPAGFLQRTLPVLRQPCDVPRRIATLTYADLTADADVEAELAKLLDALRGVRRLPHREAETRLGPDEEQPPHERASEERLPVRIPSGTRRWLWVGIPVALAILLLVLWQAWQIQDARRRAVEALVAATQAAVALAKTQTPEAAATGTAIAQAAATRTAEVAATQTAEAHATPPAFQVEWVMGPEFVEPVEFEVEPGVLPTEAITDLLRLDRVVYGRVDGEKWAYDVRLVVENAGSESIRLELNQSFFTLEDRQGRAANLVYFCCPARGEVLVPGQEREVRLIFEERPEWGGKGGESVAFLRVRGFLPIVRASWAIGLLVTAD